MTKQKFKTAKNFSSIGKCWEQSVGGYDVWRRNTNKVENSVPTDIVDFVVTRSIVVPNVENRTYEKHDEVASFVTLEEAIEKANDLNS